MGILKAVEEDGNIDVDCWLSEELYTEELGKLGALILEKSEGIDSNFFVRNVWLGIGRLHEELNGADDGIGPLDTTCDSYVGLELDVGGTLSNSDVQLRNLV